MSPSDATLASHFRDLNDAELRCRLDSGDLTAAAFAAAAAELRARNLDLAAASAVDTAQTERPAQTVWRQWMMSSAGGSSGGAGSWLGWIYFACVLAFVSFALVAGVAGAGRSSPGILAVGMATLLLDIVACIGFWGWLQSVRIGCRGIWVVCVALKFAQLFAAAAMLTYAKGRLVAPEMAGMAFELPLLRGLWRYAASRIWSAAPSVTPGGASQ